MKPSRRKQVFLVWLLVSAGVATFALANAHLVYVATTSQPECIAHLKSPGEAAGSFRAAKPAC